MDYEQILADNLKELLKARQMSQKELADLTDLTPQSISKYLKDGKLSVSTLVLIANKLNVSVDWLLGRANKTNPTDTPKDISLADQLESLVNIVDSLGASFTTINDEPFGPELKCFYFPVNSSIYSPEEYCQQDVTIRKFIDAWAAYRVLLSERKIDENDYCTLLNSRLKQVRDDNTSDEFVKADGPIPF